VDEQKGRVAAMKGRYLLVLAVIAVALVLALPGVAQAAYESSTQVTLPADCTYWDLDGGVTVTDPAVAEVHLIAAEGGYGSEYGSYFGLNDSTAPVEWFVFWDPATGAPTLGFDNITYGDLASLTWESSRMDNGDAPFVVHTAPGNYYKLQFVQQGVSEGQDWIFRVQRLVPNNPPTMLTDLGGFISMPTVGAINPTVAKVLKAEVDLAAKALAQAHPKVAVALLKVLIAEVKVLPVRLVSADARTQIIAQANAIIAALNQ
jgi:hypothetical protein